jgi:hypothetical protein
MYSEYTSQATAYKKSLSAGFDEYATLIKKSDSFLSRYAELLGRSQRAIEGDAGGDSYLQLSRGSLREAGSAAAAKATEIGERLPPSGYMGAAARLGEIGVAAAKPLGQAAAYGSAALMEGAHSLDTPALGTYFENQSLPRDDSGEIVTIEPPDEPFEDDTDIIDGETGENLTDPKFRE